MTAILFALAAGVLTIAAPCTLPVLPILLGASIGQTSRSRPVLIALGFVTAFAAVAVAFSVFTRIIGVDQNTLRTVAVVLLIGFGLLLLWPHAFERLAAHLRALVPATQGVSSLPAGRHAGAFVLGATLGLVWTPCAGPVLASILTVIATQSDVKRGALLLAVYAVGAAIPMLAIAYGGQAVSTRVRAVARIAPRLQQAFGAIVIAFAIAMYFQYDTQVVLWLSDFYPNAQLGL